MLSLNSLPVELVVEILNGASLRDILNVTRVSTFFHEIGCSCRALWVNAQDANRIPLPMGKTLDTVSLLSVSRLAAYAIALSTVWSQSVAHPLRISYIVPYPPRRPTLVGNIPPVYSIFLPGNQWLIIDMHTDSPRVCCLASGEYFPLTFEGNVYRYAYESFHNGSSVVLAVVKARSELHGTAWFLDVYILQFDHQRHFHAIPHVRRALSIRITAWAYPPHVDLKGSLVVVSAGNKIFIVNWQKRCGVMLTPYLYLVEDHQTEEELSTMRFHWKACFHPELQLLMAEKVQRSCTSIHVISCPSVLHPFEGVDLTDETIVWPTELLVSTRIHTLAPRQDAQYRSFHRPGGSPLIFTLVHGMRGILNQDNYLCITDLGELSPEKYFGKLEFKRHVFERRAASGRTVCLGIHPSENALVTREGHAPPEHRGKVAATWIRKRVTKSFNLLSMSGSNQPVSRPNCLFFLRMPEGSGQELTWVRLELPRRLMLQGISQTSVLAFDDVYGTLLLDDEKGNYCIVQY